MHQQALPINLSAEPSGSTQPNHLSNRKARPDNMGRVVPALARRLGRFLPNTTVEFLPFGLDWTHVTEIRFSENKDLPDDNDPPRRQKVRNSTVELSRIRWVDQRIAL
jgi:hypothetical protein